MWLPGVTAALSLAAAVLTVVCGAALLARSKGKGLHAGVGGCLALIGLGHMVETLGLLSWVPDTLLLCLGLSLQLLQPAGLFWANALVAGAPASADRTRAVRRASVVSLLCVLSAGLAWGGTTLEVGLSESGAPVVALGPLGRFVFGAHVLLLALGIAQFEALLRAVQYPLRYSLKFFLPALVAPAVYQIFFSSQLLLLRMAPLDRTLPNLILLAVALGLVGLGLRAERGAPKAPLYVAPQIVYGSVTFLVVGLYLVAVGALGDLLRRALPAVGTDLTQVVVLLALLGLAVAALSRKAQAEMRRFVATRLYRSRYDYREKWLEVTEAFESCRTVDAILDRLLDVLARTFNTGRLSLWVRFDADDRFHQVRSMNLEAAPPPLEASHPVVQALVAGDGAVNVSPDSPRGQGHDGVVSFTEATLAVLCAPVRSQGDLLAFAALGPAAGGEAYGTDDRNLLRAVTHHAGVLLSHARLAEERRAAAELEALHRVSAFCVHDLKNLAASLSLVAGNAKTHGSDPAFQESALRTVGRTADRIMALVRRLSRRSTEVAPVVAPADVDEAIDETLASLNEELRAQVRRERAPVSGVATTKDELHQVLLNLILNAADANDTAGASGDGERIVVRTSQRGDRVFVSVADSGPGLSAESLQTLFQPFRTTKSGGLGLGLYECKKIVEAHRGRISARSEPGHGTEFVVELPVWSEAAPNA